MTNAPDLQRLQAMDESAWSDLQSQYGRRVFFFVKRYVQDHQTAEDITQDVFLGAVKGIANFNPEYTFDQFLFGIAKNRVIDHFRKHKVATISSKAHGDSDASMAWIENMPEPDGEAPAEDIVIRENALRQKDVLGRILKEYVASLWQDGEFQKLQVLESLFVLGQRNKDVAQRFGIADEKAVAGIKFRAIDKLRSLARQNDPNHSLFGGLWEPGAR